MAFIVFLVMPGSKKVRKAFLTFSEPVEPYVAVYSYLDARQAIFCLSFKSCFTKAKKLFLDKAGPDSHACFSNKRSTWICVTMMKSRYSSCQRFLARVFSIIIYMLQLKMEKCDKNKSSFMMLSYFQGDQMKKSQKSQKMPNYRINWLKTPVSGHPDGEHKIVHWSI